MAKLTQLKAIELLRKLSRVEKFPEDDAGIKAIAATLMEACADYAHAEKTVDELRRSCRYIPTDAEIFHVASGLRVPEWKPNRGACPNGKCDGSGWIPVVTGMIDGVKPCSCRGGSK